MQVFVKRADLGLVTVPVFVFYPESPIQDRSRHGTEYAVLSLPNGAVFTDQTTLQTILTTDWRETHVEQIVNDEARRRIDESFPEYMQRNSNWAMIHNITRYGVAPAGWPAEHQASYATAEQGWDYIDDIRQVADAMISNLPNDPTADANWPTRIPPVYIPI